MAPGSSILWRLLLLSVFVTGACNHGTTQPSVSSSSSPTSSSSASPTGSPSASASPTSSPTSVTPASGAPSATCLEGWQTPRPGSALRTEPLDLIRSQQAVTGLFVVAEMRYFESPELPWIVTNAKVVKTWYVKAYLRSDPSFRGRWLVQRRSAVLAGIAAVAPYTSAGYRSPDWRSFEGEGPPRSYPGLPGTWAGINYDAVTGRGDGFPVLARTSSGCLAGTGPIQTALDPNTPGLLSKGAAHVEVTGDLLFTGSMTLTTPSVYIGASSGDPFGMDVRWSDGRGHQLVLAGSPSAGRTSSRFVLGLALGDGKPFFVSNAGECTVTITLSRAGRVRGSLVCSVFAASGNRLEVKARFSGS